MTIRDRLPLATIVISSYNYGRFLAETIDSALSQTYARVEVIVVDDGSTDNSHQVMARYGTRGISMLKDNAGQASAINAGFRRSAGQVICFLDSDDALLPTTLERGMRQFHEDDVVKVHWPLWVVDEHSVKTDTIIPPAQLSDGNLRDQTISGTGRAILGTTAG